MQDDIQRKIFIVADMVISGEKEGTVTPSPKDVGIIVMGDNLLLFDETVATIMGFDYHKIPTFDAVKSYKGKYKYYSDRDYSAIVSNISAFNGKRPENLSKEVTYKYISTSGWEGHIENERSR